MSLDKFAQDGQDPKVVEKIYSKIQKMLMANEAVKYIAMQKKPAVTLLPDCIIISNRRIFLCEFTKLGLSINYEIFSWQDIKDISFKEEIFGSKVTVIPFSEENLSIDYIPKAQARKLFQLIKEALENKDNTDKQPEAPKEVAKPVVPIREAFAEAQAKQSFVEEEPIKPTPTPVYTPPVFTKEIVIEEKVAIAPKEEIIEKIEAVVIPTPPLPVIPPTSTRIIEEEEDEMTLKLKKLKSLYDKQLITQSEYDNKKAEILEKL